MWEFLISTNVPAFALRLEHGAGAKVTERADDRVGTDPASIATVCEPTSAPVATRVRPRRTVKG